MRWFEFESKCRATAVYAVLMPGDIAVPSVVGHVVARNGCTVRLRASSLSPMHTTMAVCANCGLVVWQSPVSTVSSVCLGICGKWKWGGWPCGVS